MGGYAAYVWPAYAVAALVLIGLLGASLRDLRRRQEILGRLEALRPARAKATERGRR
jgi:heme exporter protein D